MPPRCFGTAENARRPHRAKCAAACGVRKSHPPRAAFFGEDIMTSGTNDLGRTVSKIGPPFEAPIRHGADAGALPFDHAYAPSNTSGYRRARCTSALNARRAHDIADATNPRVPRANQTRRRPNSRSRFAGLAIETRQAVDRRPTRALGTRKANIDAKKNHMVFKATQA